MESQQTQTLTPQQGRVGCRAGLAQLCDLLGPPASLSLSFLFAQWEYWCLTELLENLLLLQKTVVKCEEVPGTGSGAQEKLKKCLFPPLPFLSL